MIRIQYPFCDNPAKDAHPESKIGEASNKPKLREISQKNWPLTFKSVKVMKVRKTEALFLTQLNTTCGSELDLSAIKAH